MSRCIDEKSLWVITIFNLQPQHRLTGYLARLSDGRWRPWGVARSCMGLLSSCWSAAVSGATGRQPCCENRQEGRPCGEGCWEIVTAQNITFHCLTWWAWLLCVIRLIWKKSNGHKAPFRRPLVELILMLSLSGWTHICCHICSLHHLKRSIQGSYCRMQASYADPLEGPLSKKNVGDKVKTGQWQMINLIMGCKTHLPC